MGASQNGGKFLATSGELHWDLQPATLDNPKSGMHPGRWGASQIFGGEAFIANANTKNLQTQGDSDPFAPRLAGAH